MNPSYMSISYGNSASLIQEKKTIRATSNVFLLSVENISVMSMRETLLILTQQCLKTDTFFVKILSANDLQICAFSFLDIRALSAE
jgi:3-phenylpropionate/cinnamic acid dioxygenase small subunit